MKPSSSDWWKAVFPAVPLALLLPSCSNEGWDPTTNMGRPGGGDEVKYIAKADGTIDIGTLGKLSKYIRGQRRLNRSEEQILTALAAKQIGGYRFERIRVLEQKRAAVTKQHQSQKAVSASRYQARVAKIEQSPAPQKPQLLETAKREYQAETKQQEAAMNREIVLIESQIKAERSKTYVVPVRDSAGSKDRSVVLIDSSNRIKDSKIYQIDRSVVDLAKVLASEQPDMAVLTDVRPLSLPSGL